MLGARVVVFMIGGMSYNEIRAVYEVAEEAQREVLIGGPCILTPKAYLDCLASFPGR
jgi:syntaxin-binding protein 1